MRGSTSADDIFVKDIISRMSVEEKVGQCFNLAFAGRTIRPNVLESIQKLHCGGIRLVPYTDMTYGEHTVDRPPFYTTLGEYADLLNQLQRLAIQGPGGIPLHVTVDWEGGASGDIGWGGIIRLPSCMGLATSGDPDLVYRAHHMMARQMRAMGVTHIHSPVLDVNNNPRNPEIGSRSYSDDPDTVIEMARMTVKAFHDAGIAATGKHFPGRGNSAVDAHFTLPALDSSREELDKVELKPFRALVKEGIDFIMTAHMAVPALDPEGHPATASRRMLVDLLRGELGFDGIITTDNMVMLGIREKYGNMAEACARAIQAGCDLVLMKSEGAARRECVEKVLEYVRDGRIPEQELDEHVYRNLRQKMKQGLFCEKELIRDPSEIDQLVADPGVRLLEEEATEKCLVAGRLQKGVLPLKGTEKILVIDSVTTLHSYGGDQFSHAGMLAEQVFRFAPEADWMEMGMDITDDVLTVAVEKAGRADIVIIPDYASRVSTTSSGVIEKMLALGKKVIVVSLEPYAVNYLPEDISLVITFANTMPGVKAAVEYIFGKREAKARLRLDPETLKMRFKKAEFDVKAQEKYQKGEK